MVQSKKQAGRNDAACDSERPLELALQVSTEQQLLAQRRRYRERKYGCADPDVATEDIFDEIQLSLFEFDEEFW